MVLYHCLCVYGASNYFREVLKLFQGFPKLFQGTLKLFQYQSYMCTCVSLHMAQLGLPHATLISYSFLSLTTLYNSFPQNVKFSEAASKIAGEASNRRKTATILSADAWISLPASAAHM